MVLGKTQIRDFERNGFLILDDVLSEADREPLVAEYTELVERVAAARGHVDARWQALNFEQRFTRLVASDPDAYEFLDITLPLRNDLTTESGMHAGPAVFGLLTHPQLLDIAESIMGPEIVSNPVQHVRIKPPESALNAVGQGNSNMARTGWHQDAAVILEHAEASPILTVWVAVTDATSEMGCMQAVPGSHRWKGLGTHCPGRTGAGEIYIPQTLYKDHPAVDLPVRAGGVVLLHRKTWHGAGPNLSERIRWSFDLRYQPAGSATGRECFPHFLARSSTQADQVVACASDWSALWQQARMDIGCGAVQAVFNERWEQFSEDPICA